MSLEELEALLLVQERDTALDRLRHQRATLPERAELEARTATLVTKRGEHATVLAEREKVHAEERRLDDESRSIGAHIADVDKKLYSGTISSPRELQAMQADVEMLKRQRSDLEDEELEVMEQREVLDGQLDGLATEVGALETAVAELQATIAAREAEIDTNIAEEQAARDGLAAPVAEALLRDYEKRRVQNKGAGAARLVGTTCQACHLTIPSTEAEQIRRDAGATISYCDNCSAILVP